jgi:Na+/H+ antiporter NhaA
LRGRPRASPTTRALSACTPLADRPYGQPESAFGQGDHRQAVASHVKELDRVAFLGDWIQPPLDYKQWLQQLCKTKRLDTLNRFEDWWRAPVQFGLLFFGLANAGVPFTQIGPGTYYVLAGFLVGKPLGILVFSAVGPR